MNVDWIQAIKYGALFAFLLLLLTAMVGWVMGGNIVTAAILSAIISGIITGVIMSLVFPRQTSGGLTDVEVTGSVIGALLFAFLALSLPAFNIPAFSQGAMIFSRFATEAVSAAAAAAPQAGFNIWAFLLLFATGLASAYIAEITQRAVVQG